MTEPGVAASAAPERRCPAAFVRPGLDGDLPALTDIYNHYVLHSTATFDVEPFSVAARRPWFAQYSASGAYRLLVAERAGEVLGYATSSRFRPKPAYHTSVETTVYCRPDAVGQGVGSALYQRLFDELRGEDVHRAFAVVALPNQASVRLHHRFGFRDVGVLHEVGRKFGRYWDVLYLEAAVC